MLRKSLLDFVLIDTKFFFFNFDIFQKIWYFGKISIENSIKVKNFASIDAHIANLEN